MMARRVFPVAIVVSVVLHVAGNRLLTPVAAQVVRAGASAGVQVQSDGGVTAYAQAGVEVQTRGPVHEAFAEMVSFEPQATVIVEKNPPDPIEEIPPEQKPEGENVEWIPGYWNWDDERTDFIWVSGIWRFIPPEQQFVPGYWTEVSGGFQWVSGHWARIEVTEVEYKPEPPKTLEVGPNIQAPSSRHIWTPGCWIWRETRYLWRPGYWVVSRPDWNWVPSHYVWAPGGYIFVDGYWDFDAHLRGVLFAPVYYERPIYTQVNYTFSPSITINTAVVTDHLFCRPTYHHYYFGDYYEARYSVAGILPSFSFHASVTGYDPFFAHMRVQGLLADRNWEQRVRTQFEYRQAHVEVRPPHTFSAQLNLAAAGGVSAAGSVAIAQPLSVVAASTDAPLHFARLSEAQRVDFGERGKQVQAFRAERQKLEKRTAVERSGKAPREWKPVRMKLAQSPVTAKARGGSGKGKAGISFPSATGRGGGKGGPARIAPAKGAAKASTTIGKDRTGRTATGRSLPGVDTKPSRGGSGKGAAKAVVQPDRRGPSRVSPSKGAPKIDTKPDRRGPSRVSPSKDTPKIDAKPDRRGPSRVSPSKDTPKIDAKPDRGGPSRGGAPKVQVKPDRGGSSKEEPKGGGRGKGKKR